MEQHKMKHTFLPSELEHPYVYVCLYICVYRCVCVCVLVY